MAFLSPSLNHAFTVTSYVLMIEYQTLDVYLGDTQRSEQAQSPGLPVAFIQKGMPYILQNNELCV